MKLIRIVLWVILIPVGAFALFLLFAGLTDYKPELTTPLPTEKEATLISDTAILDLMIWNIGYAGLDQSMDFFYDGGEQMRPSREGVLENLEGIGHILQDYSSCDFLLLQEVDKDSKRSYHINQVRKIRDIFPAYSTNFGLNYKVSFVPIPLSNPMGKVESGLLSLSRHHPMQTDRYSFPGNYSWPMKLFMLDRCFMVQRFQVEGGKELLVVNTHNSAYDDGNLRQQQMEYLREFLLNEYQKGNYLVIGGDWNQSPHGLVPELPQHVFDTVNLLYVEEGYPAPGWTWAYGKDMPTNRRVATPYKQESSPTTIIDYFLLSPNISEMEVSTRDVGFRYSDHQPVRIKIQLKP